MLFLNKFDEFEEKYKVEKIPLPNLGADFPQPPCIEDEQDDDLSLAIDWFKKIYLSQSRNGRLERNNVQVTVAIKVEFMSDVISNLIANIARQIVQDFYPEL